MLTSIMILFLALASNCQAKQLHSRSILRGGETGMVNLVEFNMRGTIYGKCSYRFDGDMIEVVFEDNGEELTAKTDNPTIVDPVSKARMCRELSTRVPEASPQSRSELGEPIPETNEDLMKRLHQFQAEMASNQDYVNDLKPRFFGLLSAFLGANSNNFGITFGGSENSFPGFNLSPISLGFGSGGWWGKKRRS